MFRCTVVLLLLVTALPAQATKSVLFECQGAVQTPIPQLGNVILPPPGYPDCDGLTTTVSNLGGAFITALPACGMPTQGQAYLALGGNATYVTVPAGGPLPRPLPFGVVEARIPMPWNAISVSFAWDFYLHFQGGSYPPPPPPVPPQINGMDVSIVDPATGLAVANLLYVDATTAPFAPGGCTYSNSTVYGQDTFVDGPQTLTTAIPALPPGAYLSVVCWRGTGGYGIWLSAASMDDVVFTLAGFSLWLNSFFPGSLTINNIQGPLAAPYLTLFTSNAGAFPYGALGGLDILPGELAAQLALGGPPITGILSGGSSFFSLGPGSLPSGLTLYAVTAAAPTSGAPIVMTLPTSVTIL